MPTNKLENNYAACVPFLNMTFWICTLIRGILPTKEKVAIKVHFI